MDNNNKRKDPIAELMRTGSGEQIRTPLEAQKVSEGEKRVAAPRPAALAKKSKKQPFVKRMLKTVGIVIVCFAEEAVNGCKKLFKAVKSCSMGIKMTAAAVLFACLCTCLVFGLAMLVNGEADEQSVSDCVIGADKHVMTAAQKASYVTSAEEKADKAEGRYTVTFDFYSKEDVSCVSEKRTVGSLIELLGIELGEADVLSVKEDEKISGDTVIRVDEITYGTEKVTTAISYETEYRDVRTVPRGTEKVQRRGTEGKSVKEYSVTYINGKEVERELSGEYVSAYPVSCVIVRGVGGTVNIGGKSVSYSYYIDCDSTFYYSGGITASGLPADEKVVAVDPRVIPLGTSLYVEGIGTRIAADTGGAIKGNIIDICFDRDNPITATYGRRDVRVYILD